MKYDKNQFTTVPNKDKHKGLSPYLQTLYMWLCNHSDKDMLSFPSRKTLAAECGMSVRTLDRTMQELVTLGLIVKAARYNNNEQSTNFYEVVLFAQGGDTDAGGGDTQSLGGDRNSTQNSIHLTQSIKQKDTDVSLAKAEYGNAELNELFQYWQSTTGLAITARMVYNRRAASSLLKKYGAERLRRLIDGVATAQGEQFAPQISSFEELQSKLDKLLVWGKKRVSKKGTIKI